MGETPNTATPAAAWQSNVRPDGKPLELPSGNVALVRPVEPQAFLTSGLIPNPLMTIIRKAINEAQGLPPKMLEKIMEDDKLLQSALELFDRLLVYVIVEPQVSMPPPCKVCGEYANRGDHNILDNPKDAHRYVEGERDLNVLYADVVDMDDKLFIAQWCLGGTSDLIQFREQQASSVATLSGQQDVEGATV